MVKKKVLIITYYWPPAGGGGVQRWLKFAKYLNLFEWEPIIYTPKNPGFTVRDESLFKDIPENIKVLKYPIWEPYNFYRIFTGRSRKQGLTAAFTSEQKNNILTENISNWVRSNFFIPDARVKWVKPSVKFLLSFLKKNKIDIVITTGPPHSLHLIGLNLKKRINIKWIADFRDPWTNIDYYKELKLTNWADKKHHLLEEKVLKNADRILVVGNNMKTEFLKYRKNNIHVINNGFDTDDIKNSSILKLDNKFSIAHLGVFMKHRNPLILWKVISSLAEEYPDFKNNLEIKLIGNIDYEIINSIKSFGLYNFLYKEGYMPHEKIILIQRQSQLLLLLINQTGNAKGMLTGKFYEYLAARRPILAIGPVDGDAAAIIKETESGLISGFDDEEGLKKNILTFYNLYKKDELNVSSKNLDKFTRKKLTFKLSKLLNELVNNEN